MLFNYYQAEITMQERMKNALREAEHRRLVRAVKSRQRARGRRASLTLMLNSLAGIAINRSLGCSSGGKHGA